MASNSFVEYAQYVVLLLRRILICHGSVLKKRRVFYITFDLIQLIGGLYVHQVKPFHVFASLNLHLLVLDVLNDAGCICFISLLTTSIEIEGNSYKNSRWRMFRVIFNIFSLSLGMPKMMRPFVTSHLVLKSEMYGVLSVGSGDTWTRTGSAHCLGKTSLLSLSSVSTNCVRPSLQE